MGSEGGGEAVSGATSSGPTTRAFALCGAAPLTARREPWQSDLLARPELLDSLLAEYGSPLNLIDPGPMERNVSELRTAGKRAGIDLGVYFARKANKSLGLVDRAADLGCGVDVASIAELAQTLERGVPAARIIVTAAVKPRELLELCARAGVTVVIDNEDELMLAGEVAETLGESLGIAYRLAVSGAGDGRPPTRFGIATEDVPALHARHAAADGGAALRLEGLHFHFDGYDPADRARGIELALGLATELETLGSPVRFIDIGGGVPMRYLDDSAEWDRFWSEHHAGLRGEREPLTYLGHALGADPASEAREPSPEVYPSAQELVRGGWLERVLAPVAPALRERGIELRCEPGRALLDGCGMTLARVTFRKRGAGGDHLVGLAMNRTQMRTAAIEAMVDPLLVRPSTAGSPSAAFDGYLVGAYCIERELLSWRRLRFDHGAAVGDIVAFPNTAGYFMHILESSSHQMPLAANLLVEDGVPRGLDPIDNWSISS
jgi:diaminopimelate decarboxylase